MLYVGIDETHGMGCLIRDLIDIVFGEMIEGEFEGVIVVGKLGGLTVLADNNYTNKDVKIVRKNSLFSII